MKMTPFEKKLIMLITDETKGETLATGVKEGVTADVAEAMASQLGKLIALQCGGRADLMNMMLEASAAYMFEVAAQTQKAGHFLGNPSNWRMMRRGADGKLRPDDQDEGGGHV